jgi:hypothetical protein
MIVHPDRSVILLYKKKIKELINLIRPCPLFVQNGREF